MGACRRPTVIDALGVFGDLSPGGRPDRSHIALRWSRSWHPPCYDTAMVRGLVLVSSRPAKAARPSQKRARTRCTGTLAKASATQASSVEGAHARVIYVWATTRSPCALQCKQSSAVWENTTGAICCPGAVLQRWTVAREAVLEDLSWGVPRFRLRAQAQNPLKRIATGFRLEEMFTRRQQSSKVRGTCLLHRCNEDFV